MKIKDLGLYYPQQLATIATLAAGSSLWRHEAAFLLPITKMDFTDTDTLMQTLHEVQKLNQIVTAGLENDRAFRLALTMNGTKSWNDFTAPPVSLELQHNLAEKLYNATPGSNDVALIDIGDTSREIAQWLVERCQKDKIKFGVHFFDANFQALLLNHASDENVRKLAEAFVTMNSTINKRMVAYPGMPEGDEVKTDPDKGRLFQMARKPFSERITSGDVFYTLTIIPTRKDAEIDQIDYQDYIKLFFEMCDQPWDRISKAQVALIKEFNAATKVRITNNDGTDVSMELVDDDGSHFTFCNSLIAKNVPGSEIFSAPRRNSVNGKVVAKGQFEHDGEIVENLTLEFNNGELVRYDADKGLAAFTKIVTMDEGARYVGELGIGTNPHLKRHVSNGLLVEKIGGSFHLALGRPYSYTSYMGEPVKVDNGGKSALHWDLTTMLHGKQGRIYLDGRMIMDDGKWLDKKYDVLNRGWQSVPKAERPDYWKNYYTGKSSPAL